MHPACTRPVAGRLPLAGLTCLCQPALCAALTPPRPAIHPAALSGYTYMYHKDAVGNDIVRIDGADRTPEKMAELCTAMSNCAAL